MPSARSRCGSERDHCRADGQAIRLGRLEGGVREDPQLPRARDGLVDKLTGRPLHVAHQLVQ
eukprot:16037070-Heterocapsa_arctica.AAC.1